MLNCDYSKGAVAGASLVFHSAKPAEASTLPVVENPFFHRGPVRLPAYFFGRAAELHSLRTWLQSGQSVAIHGQRRLGKTSLLFQLQNTAPATWRVAYVDGGQLDGLDETWFYGAIDRALGGSSDTAPYASLLERVRTTEAQEQKLILLLDEFELLAANPHLGPAVFNRLRALAAQHPLAFVVAARDPLVRISFAHPDTLSSPFFNIFAPLALGLWAETEARTLWHTLSSRASAPFSAETLDWLWALAGPHPLFAQVAGYRAFAAYPCLTLAERAAALALIEADLEPHCAYYWSRQDEAARYTLATLASGHADPATLADLQTAALVHGTGYVNTIWQMFVRRQRVPQVWHAGPLLVDARRNIVSVHGQIVHLTPTEFAALRLFVEQRGRALTAEALEAALWPGEVVADPERARGVVKKLRAALGEAGELVVNRRGLGWLIE